MLLEAIETPIRYRWPKGKIDLIPGQPVDVSVERGAKILKKCGGKVRTVQPDWSEVWRNLAQLTDEITKNDPRFHPVCAALEDCDRAFEQDNWAVFQQNAESVKRLAEGRS